MYEYKLHWTRLNEMSKPLSNAAVQYFHRFVLLSVKKKLTEVISWLNVTNF